MWSGYLPVTRWRRAAIRMHWTTPIGAWAFAGFSFSLVPWIAFLGIVLLHEMGHAIVARRCGAFVHSIDVTPLGGRCSWSGDATPIQRACIAFGGVWAQLVLLAIGLACMALPQGVGLDQVRADLVYSLVPLNAIIIVLNLLPFPSFDGAEAWQLFPLLVERGLKRRRFAKLARQAETVQRELDALGAEDDEGADGPLLH